MCTGKHANIHTHMHANTSHTRKKEKESKTLQIQSSNNKLLPPEVKYMITTRCNNKIEFLTPPHSKDKVIRVKQITNYRILKTTLIFASVCRSHIDVYSNANMKIMYSTQNILGYREIYW